MQNKESLTKISSIFLAAALFIVPGLSYADWGNHDDHRDGGHFYHYHDRPHFGLHVGFLPHGYFSLWVGGARYYYYDGLYYNYVGGDYVLVSPPVGAVVTTIPPDFQPTVINGMTYYVNNGNYYVYTASGYQVVAAPTMVVQAPVTAVQPAPPVEAQGTFTINIPNNSGGFTAVVIKESGNGYVGPQGEFYAEFPKVAQLKVLYGK